jgi:uncharacterized protein (DUF1499 family)
MLRIIAIGVILGVGIIGVLIRLAPTDATRWHRKTEINADENAIYGVRRYLVAGDRGMFERLAKVAQTTPRTQLIAGSVEEGFVTYQTRSLVFGFPDYTTVWLEADGIRIFGRLRYGRSDLGVNRRRVDNWIARSLS